MENTEPQLINVLIKHEKWAELKSERVMDGIYEISSTSGHILEKETGRVIYPFKNSNGYLSCTLLGSDNIRKPFRHHRVMAETFVPHLNEEQNLVNHLNGIKTTNYPWNLEWCTAQENTNHAIRTGLFMPKKVVVLDDEKARTICELLVEGKSYREILDHIGMDSSDYNSANYDLIGNIKRGITWKHVSCEFDFSKLDNIYSVYTTKQIQTMCLYLEAGNSFKEIYEKMFNLPYANSRVNKSYYEFIRKLRNRQTFPEITKDYTF